jgi:hypothetical protein
MFPVREPKDAKSGQPAISKGTTKSADFGCLFDSRQNFKIGHCDFQTRPLASETGQYPKAIGVADRAWNIAQLVDAALAVVPALPTETPSGSSPQVCGSTGWQIAMKEAAN